MPPIRNALINVLILGFFLVGASVAAASFGLFGCVCPPNQYQLDPPSYTPMPEPGFSTAKGSKQ